MNDQHYSDYLSVPLNYKPVMTLENFEQDPNGWLDFFPHETYLDFLRSLFNAFESAGRSVWLRGNYGTGKSYAALVTQRLLMSDVKEVQQWITKYERDIPDAHTLENEILKYGPGSLVVYDYNASGLGYGGDFLARLEKSVACALRRKEMTVPLGGNLDAVIERLEREGDRFFQTSKLVRDELRYINDSHQSIDQIVAILRKTSHSPLENKALANEQEKLLSDVQLVLQKDSIYLNLDVNNFRTWISAILEKNGLERIVYIFDEFSEFIDAHADRLKTFEEVAETQRFFFVPVTHMRLQATHSEAGHNAKRANDRFSFCELKMPNDTALRLVAHALEIKPEQKSEWEDIRGSLWNSIVDVVDKLTDDGGQKIKRDVFQNILPIHPTTAFLLKFLAESVSANQRSIFDYLKGNAKGDEFHHFITEGGPSIWNKQYLTIDYLWKYFIERDDLGSSSEIVEIRNEYERIKSRAFANKTDDDQTLRVLRATLLFCLLNRLAPKGNERLRPTVENVKLAFQGDGAMSDVHGTLEELASKHCFSIVNGDIELFTTSVGGGELVEKAEEIQGKFFEFLVKENLLEALKKPLSASINTEHSPKRFDIRVSDAAHTSYQYLQTATREKYSRGQAKDDGTICLWFVVAKNQNDRAEIQSKIEKLLQNLQGHRIVMLTFPENTFCKNNQDLWNEYAKLQAQYILENDNAVKNQIKSQFDRISQNWYDELISPAQPLTVYFYDKDAENKIVIQDFTWKGLGNFLREYASSQLEKCPDYLLNDSLLPAVFSAKSFKDSTAQGWANAGMTLEKSTTGGPRNQFLSNLSDKLKLNPAEIDDWFEHNPTSRLTAIRNYFDDKIKNTLQRNQPLSLRKVYIELRRAPYGMECVPLSAFVLGLTLRHILKKGYCWTDDVTSGALDEKTLAEIIATVVVDDGNDNIKKEKKICRLSKEEKTFIDKAPLIFGFNGPENPTLENTVNNCANRVEQIAQRIPLWILANYLAKRDSGIETSQAVEFLKKLGEAFAISSRGKIGERVERVKEAGRILLNSPQTVDVVRSALLPENFQSAFRWYVDAQAPDLRTLAESVGDTTHIYCSSVLAKMTEAASSLWNETDVMNAIKQTFDEYDVVEITRAFRKTAFAQYAEVLNGLRNAVERQNKLPREALEERYPQLSNLFSVLLEQETPSKIKEQIALVGEDIVKLFYDPSKKESLLIFKELLNNASLTDDELLNVYNSDKLQNGFSKNCGTFLSEVRAIVAENEKSLCIEKIQTEWKRIASDAETPNEWSTQFRLPARFLFDGVDAATVSELLNAITQPNDFSVEKLNKIQEILTRVPSSPDFVACKEAFCKAIIPTRFQKFNIDFESVVAFLQTTYSKQPNDWPEHPNTDRFVEEQYKSQFAPQIVAKIGRIPAEELKAKLIELAKNNQELALFFME